LGKACPFQEQGTNENKSCISGSEAFIPQQTQIIIHPERNPMNDISFSMHQESFPIE